MFEQLIKVLLSVAQIPFSGCNLHNESIAFWYQLPCDMHRLRTVARAGGGGTLTYDICMTYMTPSLESVSSRTQIFR